MNWLFDIPSSDLERTFFGMSGIMIVLAVFGAWYIAPLELVEILAVLVFTTSAVGVASRGYSSRAKRHTKERYVQDIRASISKSVNPND